MVGERVIDKRAEVEDIILASNGDAVRTRTWSDHHVYLDALVGLKDSRCGREVQAGRGITRDRPMERWVETVVKATTWVVDRHQALPAI